jgi:lipid-A-disaccharide synthase
VKLFLLAGEASGDRLGAELMRGLRHLKPDVSFRGIAGPEMQSEGLDSLFRYGGALGHGVWRRFCQNISP